MTPMRAPTHHRLGLAPGLPLGQALVEFVVCAGALALLLVLIPVIGKYQDLSHTTQMASRYLAFDAALRGAQPQPFAPASRDSRVRERFFEDPNAALQTQPATASATRPPHPLWTRPDGQPLVTPQTPTHATVTLRTADGPGIWVLRDALDLRATGTLVAQVRQPLAAMPDDRPLLDGLRALDLQIERQMVLLADGWTSAGPSDTGAAVAHSTQIQTTLVQLLALPTQDIRGLLDPGVPAPPVGQLSHWQHLVPADRQGRP
jgi:hypothetical protein